MLEAIVRRRSVRKYTDQEVLEVHLKLILEAAMFAPSAWGKRPWHFIVVKDPGVRKKLSHATPYSKHAAAAPVVLVLAADMSLARRWIEDLSIAASHIMLEATELGYGTCFIQVRDSGLDGRDAESYVKETLSIPRGFNVECMVTLGRSGEEKPVHNTDEFDGERVHYDGW